MYRRGSYFQFTLVTLRELDRRMHRGYFEHNLHDVVKIHRGFPNSESFEASEEVYDDSRIVISRMKFY